MNSTRVSPYRSGITPDTFSYPAPRPSTLLETQPQSRALAAMKGELVKVDAQVDRLVRDMNRSIAEADKFIQSVEKEPA